MGLCSFLSKSKQFKWKNHKYIAMEHAKRDLQWLLKHHKNIKKTQISLKETKQSWQRLPPKKTMLLSNLL